MRQGQPMKKYETKCLHDILMSVIVVNAEINQVLHHESTLEMPKGLASMGDVGSLVGRHLTRRIVRLK